MNLPTEVCYRPYADRTDVRKTKIRENVAKSPYASYHIEPETGFNDPNGFLYLMVSSNFSTKLAIWSAHGLKQWALKLKIWFTLTEAVSNFTKIMKI